MILVFYFAVRNNSFPEGADSQVLQSFEFISILWIETINAAPNFWPVLYVTIRTTKELRRNRLHIQWSLNASQPNIVGSGD